MHQVSDRMNRVLPSATSAVLNLAAKLREQGRDIISLGAGEPDFDTPDHIKESAINGINSGQTKYTAIDGTASLKNAIQKKFKDDNNLDYEHDEIIVSSGAKQTLFNLCMGLLGDGDEAIIPSPYWVSYPDMVRIADAKPIFIDTGIENDFKISAEQLDNAISKKTKLLFLNSPSNPTGSCYSKNDLLKLAKVLLRNPGVYIASDDIYEKIHWGPSKFYNIATLVPELKNRVIAINGVSKCYAMTGWRIGYAGGPKDIIKAMKTVQSQSTSNPSSISQIAATEALIGDQTCVKKMLKEYEKRNEYIVNQLNNLPGFECRNGDGAFYAFPKVTEALNRNDMKTDADLVNHILNKAEVVLVPGTPFGAPGYIRFSFACSMNELENAINRISKVIK
ncbi:MAG: pyridoxal phosphate-dependent aminotransferase [Woeseiaceae bacterium]